MIFYYIALRLPLFLVTFFFCGFDSTLLIVPKWLFQETLAPLGYLLNLEPLKGLCWVHFFISFLQLISLLSLLNTRPLVTSMLMMSRPLFMAPLLTSLR